MKFINRVITLFAVLTLMFPSMATTSATTCVDELMEDMTLRQKATQLLMPDFRHWAQENQSQVDFDVMNDEVKQILIEYYFEVSFFLHKT